MNGKLHCMEFLSPVTLHKALGRKGGILHRALA